MRLFILQKDKCAPNSPSHTELRKGLHEEIRREMQNGQEVEESLRTKGEAAKRVGL